MSAERVIDENATTGEPPLGVPGFDTVSFIISWENGDCTPDEEAEGFQHLIDSGLAWSLQGMYGRRAAALIAEGVCHV